MPAREADRDFDISCGEAQLVPALQHSYANTILASVTETPAEYAPLFQLRSWVSSIVMVITSLPSLVVAAYELSVRCDVSQC